MASCSRKTTRRTDAIVGYRYGSGRKLLRWEGGLAYFCFGKFKRMGVTSCLPRVTPTATCLPCRVRSSTFGERFNQATKQLNMR